MLYVWKLAHQVPRIACGVDIHSAAPARRKSIRGVGKSRSMETYFISPWSEVAGAQVALDIVLMDCPGSLRLLSIQRS